MALSPLKFKLNSATEVVADFSNGHLPTIEGTLEVWNSDAITTIEFVFEAINTIEPSEEGVVAPMFDYHWVGETLTKPHQLAPGTSVTLPFRVFVPRAGVYNLNKFFLNVSNPGFTSVDAALSDLQHLVRVSSLQG